MKIRSLVLSMLLPAVLSGCASEAVDAGEGLDRGPLGKADNIGSCQTDDGTLLCDGMSEGSCWCDAKCHEYGDCCADKVDACGGENPDPTGPALCLSSDACGADEVCDHSVCHSNCAPGMVCPAVCFGECVPGGGGGEEGDPCSLFGDPCVDGLVCEWVCPFDADPCPNFGINPSGFCAEPAPEPDLVKCNADLPCGDGEYCRWDANEGCGADGGSGVCTPLPDACPKHFDPVCGCDGQIYGNGCEANASGQSFVPAALGNAGYLCPGAGDPPADPAPTCEGNCGSHAEGKVCYCDAQCDQYGDCCDDYADACGA